MFVLVGVLIFTVQCSKRASDVQRCSYRPTPWRAHGFVPISISLTIQCDTSTIIVAAAVRRGEMFHEVHVNGP